MNTTFDIKRFGNVLRHDALSYLQNFGWTLVVLLAIPILIWSILYVNMDEPDALMNNERYGFLLVIAIIAMILAPSRLYKNANDSRKGIQFAMLPASNMEKFLSMSIYCLVVTPILYLAGAVAIDSILALIPGKNPYGGFVFESIFSTNLVSIELDPEFDKCAQEIQLPLYRTFVNLSFVSIFMFTNMIFKKRKVSKTIGVLLLIGIALMILCIRGVIRVENIDFETTEAMREYSLLLVKRITYTLYTCSILISIIMLSLTYYKIRKQKY